MIRNCDFLNPDAIMGLPFGHIWCCNRSLADITFEDCSFEGINSPSLLNSPSDEPLTLNMLNCVVTPRKKCENIPFIEGKNITKIRLINTDLTRFSEPKIICDTPTDIEITKEDVC